MVTFLVCLVVVGGAVVAILRLTLEDGREPATEAIAADRGSRSQRLASTARRASAYLVPSEATTAGRAGTDGGAHHLLAPVVPTLGTVAIDHVLGASTGPGATGAPARPVAAGDVAHRHRTPSPTLGTVAMDLAGADPEQPAPLGTVTGAALGTVAVDQAGTSEQERTGAVPATSTDDWSEVDPEPPRGPGKPTGATVGTVPFDQAETGAWSQPTSELDTVATDQLEPDPPVPGRVVPSPGTVVLDQPPVERGVYAPMVEPTVTAPPARPRRPAPRPRPSFGRRTLRRARGLVGLVVLLVVLGTLLAVALVALAALVVVGVRAAVGT